jgi:hypothetical protein
MIIGHYIFYATVHYSILILLLVLIFRLSAFADLFLTSLNSSHLIFYLIPVLFLGHAIKAFPGISNPILVTNLKL